MLERRFGTSSDRLHDRLTEFSRPVSGGRYFAPSQGALDTALARASAGDLALARAVAGGGRGGFDASFLGAQSDSACTPPERVAAIEALRRIRMTAAEIAECLGMALSTVSAVLKRIGLGKRSRLEAPEPPNRYERRQPGELVQSPTEYETLHTPTNQAA